MNWLPLRYGSNPEQRAWWRRASPSIFGGRVQGNLPLSLNDLLNLDLGIRLGRELVPPFAVVVKHVLPLGAASRPLSSQELVTLAESPDRTAARDGTVVLGQPLDPATVRGLLMERWDLIAAPGWTMDAESAIAGLVESSSRTRVLELPQVSGWWSYCTDRITRILVDGSVAMEEVPSSPRPHGALQQAATGALDVGRRADALLAWQVVTITRTNAAVVAHDGHVLAVAAGHHDGPSALAAAVRKARTVYAGPSDVCGSVVAVDGSLPSDCPLEELSCAGVAALVVPSIDPDLAARVRAMGVCPIASGERGFAH